MAIADTISSMYENVGEVYDTITNVDLPTNKNIQNIPSTIRNSYLEIMNNGIDKIWNNWEKVEGTGETLTLNNTEEAPMKIDLKGNTYQSTTILPSEYTQVEYIESTGTQYIETGVNADSNMSIDIDYQFTLQGTASYENCFGVINSDGQYYRYHFETRTANSLSFSYYHNNVINIYEGFYTDRVRTFVDMPNLKCQTWKNGVSQLNIDLQDFGDWDSQLNFWLFRRNSNNTNLQYFSKNRIYHCKMYASGVLVRDFIPCYRNSDNVIGLYDYVNKVFYINQGTGTFTKGNNVITPTSDFPTPSPEYPQDIHIVSGDNSINVCGKNLFNPTEIWSNWFGTNCTITNQQITWSGTSTTGISRKISDINLPSGTYTISLKTISGSHTSGKRIWVDYMQGNTKITGDSFTQDGSKQKTLSDKVDNIKIGFDSADTFNNYTFVIQIEKSPTATTYEAYQGASYPISLGNIELCKIGDYQDSIKKSTGKNLFDSSITPENYYYDNSGERTYDGNILFINQTIENINYNSITISFSSKIAYASVRVCEYNSSGTFIKRALVDTNNQVVNLDNATAKIILSVNSDSNAYFNCLMINEGNTALPYEPYGKVWYLNKQIGKVVLDGSESGWSYPSTNRFNLDGLFNDYFKSAGNITYLNNYYKAFEQTSDNGTFNTLTTNTNYGFNLSSTTSNNYTIRFKDTRYTSIADFQSWLGSNNVSLYYVLATPTYTEITDTTLISQLEALNGARSYITQTNISQVNNDKPFILDVTALKELTQ